MRFRICLVLAMIAVACTEDDNGIGSQFFNDLSFDIATWDTLTMELSTIRFDSLGTDNSGALLVGHQFDSIFGEVRSSPFFEVSLDTTSVFLNEEDHRYDSITLVLNHNGYWYGDTTQTMSYTIYRLSEEIELDEDRLFNTSTFTFEDTLGQITYTPEPYENPELEITLDDSFGQELFSVALDEGNEILIFNDEFKDFLKGIVIRPTDNNNMHLGFFPDAQLRLYYNDFGQIPSEQEYFSFSLNRNEIDASANLYFNQITTNSQRSQLESILDQESRKGSQETEDFSYGKGGSGHAIRVELPYVRNILFDNPDLLIRDVILKLRPLRRLDTDFYPLPRELTVFRVDDDNEIIQQSQVNAVLVLDAEFNRETRYELDITTFFTEQLELEENNENALVFIPANFANSVTELAIGSQAHESFQSTVELNIIKLNND